MSRADLPVVDDFTLPLYFRDLRPRSCYFRLSFPGPTRRLFNNSKGVGSTGFKCDITLIMRRHRPGNFVSMLTVGQSKVYPIITPFELGWAGDYNGLFRFRPAQRTVQNARPTKFRTVLHIVFREKPFSCDHFGEGVPKRYLSISYRSWSAYSLLCLLRPKHRRVIEVYGSRRVAAGEGGQLSLLYVLQGTGTP